MNPATYNRLLDLQDDNNAAGALMESMRPRFQALATRHEDGTAPRAVSAFQLFQTPASIAGMMAEALNLRPGARVLEPSAGLGRLLDALPRYAPREVVAVEMAPQLAAELFRRTDITLKQRDFLTVRPEELGEFDAVIMNPPFHLRADIRHILWAFEFLSNGGLLVALCMDTPERERVLRPLSTSWKNIPKGAFGAEGTQVPTVMLTIQKAGKL